MVRTYLLEVIVFVQLFEVRQQSVDWVGWRQTLFALYLSIAAPTVGEPTEQSLRRSG
jgi:hypothetical protein